MGGPNDTKEEHSSNEQKQNHHPDQSSEGGNSGHGAASAMAHMISQGREHRHQAGGADDAAGTKGS